MSSLESGPHSLGPVASCKESPLSTCPLSKQCFSELIRDTVNKCPPLTTLSCHHAPLSDRHKLQNMFLF